MGLPYIAEPNVVADANGIMADFYYLLSLIGENSDPTRVQTLLEYLMGARQNVLFTGTHDTGIDPDINFFQIGYNADWNFTGGTWKFSRFVDGEAASALRLGDGTASFVLTSTLTGNLNSQMNTVFKLQATSGEDYLYFAPSWSIQNFDRTAVGIEDYRLTKVFLDTPKMIYEAQPLQAGIEVKTASDYGVPTYAKALTLTTDVVTSDGVLKMYQERGVRHWKYGFVSRHGGCGEVQLGEGSHAGKFVIERTGYISSASIFITSYWV